MANYFSLDSARFEDFLCKLGFERCPTPQGKEIVYAKEHSANKDLVVKVFTSISNGQASARSVGADAVRIVALHNGGNRFYPVFKSVRVHRTTSQESIQERVLSRINEAFARCDEYIKEKRLTVGDFAGKIGDKLRITVKILSRKEHDKRFLFLMQDDVGHTYSYWSKLDVLQVNEYYDIGAAVKGYKTFANIRETQLSDVSGKRIVL